MSVEPITKAEFAAALPENAAPIGLVDEEYCWLIPGTETAGIVVGSGIGAKDTQIVAEATLYQAVCKPVGITYAYRLQNGVRGVSVQLTQGWQRRLQDSLTQLRERLEIAGNCPECRLPYRIFRSTRPGPNQGRWYAVCKKHDHFYWLGN